MLSRATVYIVSIVGVDHRCVDRRCRPSMCRSSVSTIDVSIVRVDHRCVDSRCRPSMCPLSVSTIDVSIVGVDHRCVHRRSRPLIRESRYVQTCSSIVGEIAWLYGHVLNCNRDGGETTLWVVPACWRCHCSNSAELWISGVRNSRVCCCKQVCLWEMSC